MARLGHSEESTCPVSPPAWGRQGGPLSGTELGHWKVLGGNAAGAGQAQSPVQSKKKRNQRTKRGCLIADGEKHPSRSRARSHTLLAVSEQIEDAMVPPDIRVFIPLWEKHSIICFINC